jgi:hypothetical protein
MAKSIIEASPILPDIDKQIDFIKRIRKDVMPSIQNLQNQPDMIFAIEQSLMAAKIFAKAGETISRPDPFVAGNPQFDNQHNQILHSFKIKPTSIRTDILKAILDKEGNGFSVSEIYKKIIRSRLLSKTTVIATINLFKARGLIIEVSDKPGGKIKPVGRPETKFKYKKRPIALL